MRPPARKPKNRVPLPPLTASGLKTYLRLLGYARPHWAMFLLGVKDIRTLKNSPHLLHEVDRR